jgi:hypothetical protein
MLNGKDDLKNTVTVYVVKDGKIIEQKREVPRKRLGDGSLAPIFLT